jgi:hypothetical protein
MRLEQSKMFIWDILFPGSLKRPVVVVSRAESIFSLHRARLPKTLQLGKLASPGVILH